MILDNNLIQRLKEYDEAFDFYMDAGRLPDQIPKGDMLGLLISQTIDENPQLSGEDPLWVEVFKDELLKFIEAMIQLFQPLDERYRKEKAYIKSFLVSNNETKRKMWGGVFSAITSNYSTTEVNINGYINQLETYDAETVFNSLAKDWDRACDEKIERLKKEAIENSRQRWELHVRDHGFSDYEERKKIEEIFYSYPKLSEIIEIVGREQHKRFDEVDETVMRYLPLLPSPPKPSADAEEIINGKDLKNLLPSEVAILSDKQTESFFFLKYASQQLQLFAKRPKDESRFKMEQKHKKEPRLEKGPIIVAIDTSASMTGKPLKIAHSILLQLLRLARKQKRNCFLMSFSVRAKSLDLSIPNNWRYLNQFLKDRYSGGTDGEQMLNKAIGMLHTKNFGMADVLIISDFYFSYPQKQTREKMAQEHLRGTRFYGLKIGNTDKNYDSVLDKIWSVS